MLEKVIQTLTSRTFNRSEFEKSTDRFYIAIENASRNLDDWSEKQHFLNSVYERFFQGFSTKQADTHGIVYTPQEIVDFMCASVERVLQREFNTSISTPGVQILDPCVGTGNFIVNLIRRINGASLIYKYANDLFCNEIMLLPYYIASLNIEHSYYERTGEYKPFEGICFADTLALAEGQQPNLFVEENTERVQREKTAPIMVVIGNPPYNAGQKSENDNNKNRKYPVIDKRVSQTYAKDSQASNKNALGDPYVKFIRWAVDRLQGRDGIVCMVTNNSFVDQIAFDGMRKHLLQDFNQIYHFDLHGNVRKNPKLSGTTHNVFGIQVGVGITVAVRASTSPTKALYYYRVPEYWRKTEKLALLAEKGDINRVEWLELEPDDRYTWITEGIQPEFSTFMPLGTKEAKTARSNNETTIFKNYGRGVATCRDDWAYDFSRDNLETKIKRFIDTYNGEVDRWRRRGSNNTSVDSFLTYDDTKIKWSEGLKANLQRGHYIEFSDKKVRPSLYRPYCKEWLYFDRGIIERVYQYPQIFPTSATEVENTVICLSGVGSNKLFHCLVSNIIPCLDMLEKTQCFSYYTYAEDGSNRHENISDWSLSQFQGKYDSHVKKWDIFHYIYALLHHPQYRERYAENLKHNLPHIPLLKGPDAFERCKRIGKLLMELHLNYEDASEYPLKWVENRETPVNWDVKKMRLTPSKDTLVVNEWLTLAEIPQDCYQYLLGGRSALEWIIDQYQVSTHARSGIISDPNNDNDPEYIVRLVGRIVTVSIKTVKLVEELAKEVTQEDWLSEGEQQ